MANQSFDTTIINPLERPLSSDINSAQSQSHRDLRDYLLKALATYVGGGSGTFDPSAILTPGFVADSFYAKPGAVPMTIDLTPGMGFVANPSAVSSVNGIVGLNDLSSYTPLLLSTPQNITLNPAPGPGFARVDLIQVKAGRLVTDPTNRDVFNAGTQTFGNALIDKTMTFDLLGQDGPPVLAPAANTTPIGYKVGQTFAYTGPNDFRTPAYGGAAILPAVDPGYIPVAYINVQPSAASIIQRDIRDARKLLFPGGVLNVAASIRCSQQFNIFDRPLFTLPPGVSASILKWDPTNQQMRVIVKAGDLNALNPAGASVSIAYDNGGMGHGALLAWPVRALINGSQFDKTAWLPVTLLNQNELQSADAFPKMDVAIGEFVLDITVTVGNAVAGTNNIDCSILDGGVGVPWRSMLSVSMQRV